MQIGGSTRTCERYWEQRLSPGRPSAAGGSLVPRSPRTNPGSPKTIPVPSVWPSPDLLPPPRRPLQRNSTVCGLNSHRLYYIISLFKVTYESTIQVSRNFHALLQRP